MHDSKYGASILIHSSKVNFSIIIYYRYYYKILSAYIYISLYVYPSYIAPYVTCTTIVCYIPFTEVTSWHFSFETLMGYRGTPGV